MRIRDNNRVKEVYLHFFVSRKAVEERLMRVYTKIENYHYSEIEVVMTFIVIMKKDNTFNKRMRCRRVKNIPR
jgi:hypothetical protein